MTERLNEEQLSHALNELNDGLEHTWTIRDGMLNKSFTFKNFVSAFGFITQVALQAQRLNHHPDWSNTYKVVDINLSTHKCDGISALDFKLAKLIESLV